MTSIIKIKSNVCLSPENCYQIESEIPIWMLAILAGATIILLKEIYNSLT